MNSSCVGPKGEDKSFDGNTCADTKTKKLIKAFPKSGTTFFSWNCESLTTSVGRVLGVASGTKLDSSTAWNGSYSMRLDVIGNDGGNQSRGVALPLSPQLPNFFDGNYLFYRFAMKIDSNFSWGNGTAFVKTNRVKRIDDQHPTAFTSFISRNGLFIGECAYCNVTNPTIPFNFQAMSGRGWHEYIIVIKKQTSRTSSDAQFHFFMDGALQGSITNLHLYSIDFPLSEAWGGWMVSPYFQLNGTSRDGGTIWVDDIDTSNFWNSKTSGHGGSVPGVAGQGVATPTPRFTPTPRVTPIATPRLIPSPTPRLIPSPTPLLIPSPTPRLIPTPRGQGSSDDSDEGDQSGEDSDEDAEGEDSDVTCQ